MSVPVHVCAGCGKRLLSWQVIVAANFTDLVARHLVEDANEPELCGPVTLDAADAAPLADGLVLANQAEHELIERLSLVVGHRLLLEWDAVEDADRVLSMNRALLSALARALGTFLAAVAAAQPENETGWLAVVERALDIARQTAREKRLDLLGSPDDGALVREDLTKPVYVFPAPDAVM